MGVSDEDDNQCLRIDGLYSLCWVGFLVRRELSQTSYNASKLEDQRCKRCKKVNVTLD